MRKFYIVGLVVAIALTFGLVYADQITFSTYYPAPYGRYREFSTTGKTTLATDEFGNEGATAVVGIGTSQPQAILDISSTDSGFLPPRMTDAQLTIIEAIAAEGSVAYNDDQDGLVYHDGTEWQSVGGGGFGQPVWDSGWKDYGSGTTTHNFPEITGATADDLFVDLQVKKNSAWAIPAGISNVVTTYCGQGYGLAYTGLTTSSIQIKQGSNPGGTIIKYRVRIWNTL